MLHIFQITGLMDSFRGKTGALKHYQKKLHQYQEQEAETLIDIGVIFLEEDQPEKALKHFQDALKTYKNLEYPEGQAFTHDLIGDTYLTTRNTKKALNEYYKALDIYSEVGSSLETDMQEKIEEVKDIEEALNISSEDIDEDTDVDINEYDADIEDEYIEDEDEYSEEESPSKIDSSKDIVYTPKTGKKIDMKIIAEKLEESIMLMDNAQLYSEYYHDSKSTAYLQEALNTAEVIEDHDGQGTLHLMIGDIYLRNENTDKAFDHFQTALSLFEENGNQKGEAISYLLIGAVCFILNKKEDMYNVFKDSINIFKNIDYKDGELMAKSLIGMLSS